MARRWRHAPSRRVIETDYIDAFPLQQVTMLRFTHSFTGDMAALPVPVAVPAAGRWPDDVALWLVELDLQAGPALLAGFLAGDEVARMTRYARPADQVRFAVARGVLRAMLGERLGCDPRGLVFTQGEHGRPSLAAHPGVSFNVSHSGERVLIALSMLRTVGVDIEADNAMLDWRALLDLVCAPGEARTILSARAFTRCWTAKEALLKATGEGIGRGLKSIDLANAVLPSALRVVHLDELAGYSGALAFGPPTPVV